MSKHSKIPEEKKKPEEGPGAVEEEESATEETREAAAPASGGNTGELGEVLKKLEEATAEVSEQRERYLRTVADLENYRKRAVREKEEARRQANVSLLEDLLPVLDNFKLGLKSAEALEGGAAFAEGFRMVCKQLEDALKQNGLVEINPEGERFDPNYHEALAHIPNESVEDGHIIEVHRIGYKLHERLIRPAAVVISSGASGDNQETESE